MRLNQTSAVSPFDTIAQRYDIDFEENFVTKEIRSFVWQSLLKHFKPGSHILELNCGTGTDALMLAQHGITVTATDSSAAMLQVAKRKIEKNNITSVNFLESDLNDIDTLHNQQYAGVFSNFGGLNCIRDVGIVIKRISDLMIPGSHLVICLLNKICIWEMTSFLLRGELAHTFRRFHKKGVDVQIGDSLAHTWYYTPFEFKNILEPWFTVENIYGLNIFSPSPNSRSFVQKHYQLTSQLLKIDNSLRSLFPFYMLGDHFVIEARKGLS